jgi:hypothetical protein
MTATTPEPGTRAGWHGSRTSHRSARCSTTMGSGQPDVKEKGT